MVNLIAIATGGFISPPNNSPNLVALATFGFVVPSSEVAEDGLVLQANASSSVFSLTTSVSATVQAVSSEAIARYVNVSSGGKKAMSVNKLNGKIQLHRFAGKIKI